MSELALFGGVPVFDRSVDWEDFWPPVDEDTSRRLQDLYLSRRWTAFDETEAVFARSFAHLHDSRHGIFTINGTVTMQIALGAYGIGPGDEVIVPALTWYATAMAVHYVGATPVLVDIDPETLCIDPDAILRAITERTKAIIPVHLYGSMADMDRIMAIAATHGLRVIEDAAHMHGGVWNGHRIGSIGDVGSFSFQHSKTMACGDGGISITDDDEIAERMFRMKQIGFGPDQSLRKGIDGPPADLICYPFRATAFQALVLEEQLRTLDSRLARYRRAVAYLERRLGESTAIRFQKPGRLATAQSYYGWVMFFDDPAYSDLPIDLIQKALEAEGIRLSQTWGPVDKYVLFNLAPEHYRIDGSYPVTERVSGRFLWLLHAYLGLDDAQLERFADAIEKVLNNVRDLR